jgi:diguanylate cyclase (GGDEF)-like protein
MPVSRYSPRVVLWTLVLLVAAIGVGLGFLAQQRIDLFQQRQDEMMRTSVKGAVATLEREVRSLHRVAALLARQQLSTLAALMRQPGSAALQATLEQAVGKAFDDVYTHTVADGVGNVLLPDPRKQMGPLCRGDLRGYALARTRNPLTTYSPNLHPNRVDGQFGRHFDIIVQNEQGGYFFVGIRAAHLQTLLRQHELPGQQLLLVSGSDGELRENLSVDSGLSANKALPLLSEDAVKQLRGLQAVSRTAWKLAARPRPEFFEARAREIWRDAGLAWGAAILLALAAFALWQREYRRRVDLDHLNANLYTEIDERKQIEARLHALTRFDPLTGLANRATAEEFLRRTLAVARRGGHQAALLFFDIDRFKSINDSLGHGYGDMVLKQVATRLLAQIREGDMLARWGGDEFLVVMAHIHDAGNAASLAEKLVQSMRRDIAINSQDVRATLSVGIAVFPESGDDTETLIKHADLALYEAKQGGRDGYRFFSVDMDDAVQHHVRLDSELRRAIRNGEFEVYYQPRLQCASGKIASAEALLRWNHPARGIVAPGEFLQVLEESGMIVEVDVWVLDQVCQQVRRWDDAGLPPVRISVNLSGKEFAQQELVERIAAQLGRSHLDCGRIELEITETFLMENTADSLTKLHALRNMGFRLAVDDFGTGYSSLAYLKRFPIHTLKIDQSFVQHMHDNAEDREIVRTIIALAHALGLNTVAEGVESVAQLELVRQMGCDEVQGYVIAKPMTAGQLAERVA